ncbi:MAG: hypothetical protein PHT59_02915 [Candidatus Omnitrophica bacterium]|nr:hypothetical protein [Candidatus Omnitrophota bacterium]
MPPLSGPGKVPQQAPAKQKPDLKVFVLYALLACVGVVAAKYAYDFFMPGKTVAGKPAAKSFLPPLIKVVSDKPGSGSSVSTDEQKPLLTIKKHTQSAGTLTLSGIYFEGDKGYCIINDKILDEGSTIDGATVTKIGTDAVELMLNDKVIRLTIRTK